MDEPRPGDEEAWAALAARWADEAAHRAYLARCADLPALAEAGRRYKAALDRDPGDAAAQRGRDEVLRRATALALAQLPRTRPPPPERAALRRGLLVAASVALAAATAWVLLRFPRPGALP